MDTNPNEKHKSSVFALLFGNPEALRELYSAIGGVDLPPDTPIDINTLSDVLFMGQLNDISFTVDDRLVVLIEHQSTLNRNMPLRLLMYIARVYEKIVSRRKLYQKSLEKIPRPEFIVLYNGKDPCPERQTLRLSDAFMDATGLRAVEPDRPVLELEVQVYNVNRGHNAELQGRSETLFGYGTFVDKVRFFQETMPLGDALAAAVKWCTDNDVLRSFFEDHCEEVKSLAITEWNLEEVQLAWYEEGMEMGMEKGRQEGVMGIIELLKGGKSPEDIIRDFAPA